VTLPDEGAQRRVAREVVSRGLSVREAEALARRELATPIVLQTVLGSARYAQESGKHLAELRNQVTSPGGTTTEGLRVLENAGLRAAFMEAIEAAYDKARLLGG